MQQTQCGLGNVQCLTELHALYNVLLLSLIWLGGHCLVTSLCAGMHSLPLSPVRQVVPPIIQRQWSLSLQLLAAYPWQVAQR